MRKREEGTVCAGGRCARGHPLGRPYRTHTFLPGEDRGMESVGGGWGWGGGLHRCRETLSTARRGPGGGRALDPVWVLMLSCGGLTHPCEKAGSREALNFVPSHACKGSFGIPSK